MSIPLPTSRQSTLTSPPPPPLPRSSSRDSRDGALRGSTLCGNHSARHAKSPVAALALNDVFRAGSFFFFFLLFFFFSFLLLALLIRPLYSSSQEAAAALRLFGLRFRGLPKDYKSLGVCDIFFPQPPTKGLAFQDLLHCLRSSCLLAALEVCLLRRELGSFERKKKNLLLPLLHRYRSDSCAPTLFPHKNRRWMLSWLLDSLAEG